MTLSISRRAICAVAAAAALVLSGCGKEDAAPAADGAAQAEEPIRIGLVQLVEHEALDAASRGIVEGLAERGFKEGVNITIDRQNAQADQSNLHNIASRFVSNKDALVFAVATPAAQTMARATKTIPIVATAITDFESAKLVKTNDAPGGNVTGVSDIGPIAAQLELLTKFMGDGKSVGVIYSASEANSLYQVGILKTAAEKLGVALVEATVSTVNDIPQAAASLVNKVGGIYVPTDNTVASAVPALLKVTNEAKIPVVAGEAGPVRAGCLATISVDYLTLGKITGRMGADILEGKKKPAEMPIERQEASRPLVNLAAAKILGITVPEDILKNADTLK